MMRNFKLLFENGVNELINIPVEDEVETPEVNVDIESDSESDIVNNGNDTMRSTRRGKSKRQTKRYN